MQKKNNLKYLLENFEEILCGGFIITMVSIVIINVFLRYLFNYSIYWAEEVSTICFVWAVFVGASATYKHKMDIGIDLLITKAPLKVQSIIRFLVDVLLLVINAYIFYMSIVFTKISYIKPTAVLGVTSAVVNSALIFGFGLITIHTIRFLYADIKEKLGAVKKGEA